MWLEVVFGVDVEIKKCEILMLRSKEKFKGNFWMEFKIKFLEIRIIIIYCDIVLFWR